MSDDFSKIRYTHRDYESIKSDLIDAIPSLTQKWTSKEESDPGIVLVKLMSMLGDSLSYNIDKMALELYIDSVTQKKNCAKVLGLLGYKMHYYRSGRVMAHVKLKFDEDMNGNTNHVILTPFTTVFTADNINYTVVPRNNETAIDISSDTQSETVYLVEGTAVTVQFGYNDLVNNRYYFPVDNVDESALWMTCGTNTCNLVDNLYLVDDDLHVSYAFGVDEFDKPYIELVNYWKDILGTTALSVSFNLTYFKSSGSKGNISANTLEYGPDNVIVSHLSNIPGSATSEETQEEGEYNTPGRDPQTVEDARRDSANYVFTHSTLVTKDDFERASLRANDCSAVTLVDNEIINQEDLNPEDIVHRARDNFDSVTDSEDNIVGLKPYLAIIYAGFGNFDLGRNYYGNLSSSDEYFISRYDPVVAPTSVSNLGYYPYRPAAHLTSMLDSVYRGCKLVNTNILYGTTKLYPFKVAGTLYLDEPLSPLDTQSVVTSVSNALLNFYEPINHKYGELPSFLDIVSTIQSSNSHIKYFDAQTQLIEYSQGCNTQNFDITSFAIYIGLSNLFTLDKKFLRFRLRNTGDTSSQTTESDITIDLLSNLNALRDENIVIPARSSVVVNLNSIAELDALCKDLRNTHIIIYSK